LQLYFQIKMLYWVRSTFQWFSLHHKKYETLFHNIYRENIPVTRHSYISESYMDSCNLEQF
jgi:hypothetical protein